MGLSPKILAVSLEILAKHAGSEGLSQTSTDALPELLKDPKAFVWLHLDAPSDEAHEILEKHFGIHPLLIEDAFADATTPKLEVHEGYLYLIVHALVTGQSPRRRSRSPRLSSPKHLDGEVRTADLDLFIGANFLITHHSQALDSVDVVREQALADPALVDAGSAAIAHRIIDHLTDAYLPLVKRLDEAINTLEYRIVKEARPGVLEGIFELKHSLQRLRRIGKHQKALLEQLGKDELSLIPEGLRPFFRDVYDHFLRVMDQVESHQEYTSDSLDAYLSIQSHRLNDIMKILTLISTIMLPLTFITGLYGMNFDHMPGLHWQYGYQSALASMGLTALVFLFFFKRRGWL